MKVFKIILIVLVVFVLILSAGGYLFIQSHKPQYSGEFTLSGLHEEVNVYYDTYGIPHIYAQNEEDAYRALGYVHAQDRLWQMELMRRIAPGRLAEISGKDLLETDIFFRTLGINRYSEQTVHELLEKGDSPELRGSQAYLDGINQFIAKGPTPVEYLLIGLEKTPFSLLDMHNVMGYMAFSFAMAHRTDPLVSRIAAEYGTAYLNDLNIYVTPESTLIKNYTFHSEAEQIAGFTSSVMKTLPVPVWIGSNSWIVGPEKSKSGSVIFANDPHIGFAQPAVWYEAHLITPAWEFYGYHLALQPFATIGHSRNIAIGLTMFENDDINFYREHTDPDHPNQYLYKNEWLDFDEREEHIHIKDSTDISITVRSSVHGPVVTDVLQNTDSLSVISMWWIYTRFPSKLLEINYEFNHANHIDEVRSAASKIHAPGLNVMYGDKQGNIAWWASAKLPVWPSHVNSKLILNGSTGADEPTGYLDFSQNPQAENPPWNYVYSANNQPDTINNQLYPGYYLPEDRAKRIVQLLEAKEKLDSDYFKAMLLDNTSPVTPVLAKEMVYMINPDGETEEKMYRILAGWDGSHNTKDTAPVIYNKLVYTILELAMEDELGKEAFKDFLGTHLLKRSVAGFIRNDSSVWWNNVHTEKNETRTDIFNQAFSRSAYELELQLGADPSAWKWEEVHTLEHKHALGAVNILKFLFNVGPYHTGSSSSLLNNLMFTFTGSGKYKVVAGPSTRRVIDFSDIENSFSILPTGQSGNPFSPHYKDQAQMFIDGEFRKQMMNQEEIRSTSRDVLILKPSDKAN